ncbi:hypothetical protein [Luteitalea sp.]|uniref:hypothetical protein n=1 Tax=Luteitalea sp. TaxID=2004800 RepID=UPI0025BAF833|nr:hypothetical protein [Luteitalea sp.]
MTRPPDFDLTTVEGIVRTVEAMMEATEDASACTQMYSQDPKWAELAGQYATEAAHHARRLQGVAELVSVSGDLAAWQEWREQGKGVVLPEPGSAAQYISGLYPPAPDGPLCSGCGMVGSHLWTCSFLACPDCHGTGTSGERAEDGAPLVCTACQGGRRS